MFDFSKIILPIFRKIDSKILAKEIVSVQPMRDYPMSTGITNNEYWVDPGYNTLDHLKDAKMIYWLNVNIPNEFPPRWYVRYRIFYFSKETDRTMFLLRWSEE